MTSKNTLSQTLGSAVNLYLNRSPIVDGWMLQR
jgi:hypothetical protein